MPEEQENSLRKLREEVETLRDQNLTLEEQLQLQRTDWLYSHHLSMAICFGVVYGLIIGSVSYLVMYIFTPLPLSYIAIVLFVVFAIPAFAVLPPIAVLKAPNYSYRSLRVYMLFFLVFKLLLLYWDPLNIWTTQSQGLDRLNAVLPFALMQSLLIALSIVFVPQLAKRCGYRLVLNGSAFTFEVDADIATVSKHLEKIEEDFNLVLDRTSSDSNKFYFTKTSGGEKTALQLFLKGKDGAKTDVGLVMHSIVNDIPMRTLPNKMQRISGALMKWLEVSSDSSVSPTENQNLIKEFLKESKKSFHRQPVSLPSKKVIKEFLLGHWKDITIIITVVIAILSWLFPFK